MPERRLDSHIEVLLSRCFSNSLEPWLKFAKRIRSSLKLNSNRDGMIRKVPTSSFWKQETRSWGLNSANDNSMKFNKYSIHNKEQALDCGLNVGQRGHLAFSNLEWGLMATELDQLQHNSINTTKTLPTSERNEETRPWLLSDKGLQILEFCFFWCCLWFFAPRLC